MRLLVTGASGLVGHRVATLAAEQGIEVHAASRQPFDARPGIVQHRVDLLSREDARRLMTNIRPSHVVQAAWTTTHGSYWHAPANLDWVIASAELGRAFADVGGTRFIQVGSGAEYDWAHARSIAGVTPEVPATRYGQAKLAAYAAIRTAGFGAFESVDARIFWCFGPREDAARFIPYICRTHSAGDVPALSSGRQQRDLLHVDDTAAALLAIATARRADGVFNIGSGTPITLARVATVLAGIAEAPCTGLGTKPDRSDDPASLIPDVQPLRQLGWAPEMSLERGLEATYCWWRQEGRGK